MLMGFRLGAGRSKSSTTQESSETRQGELFRNTRQIRLAAESLGFIRGRAGLDCSNACRYERKKHKNHKHTEYATGAAIGLNSAFLNIVTEWLSDIKLGYCTTAFYLNESFCCWGAESGCDEFKSWSGFGPLNYVLYIAFAVRAPTVCH
jgi:hypothetical protein